jgi:ketosteroid isomerase-like protein
MSRTMKVSIIVVSLFVIGVCLSLQTTISEEKIDEDIAAAVEKFLAAFNSGNAAGVAMMYAKEAKIMPPNSEIVTGREAIQAFWKVGIDMGAKAALKIAEVEKHDDTAIEIGLYELSGGGQTLDKGKYVTIWKKVEGEWKMHRDIWNSNLPLKQ